VGGAEDGGAGEFLPQRRARQWSPEGPPAGIDPVALYLPDQGQHTEVVYARSTRRPRVADLRSLWQQRWNRRPSAVLLVAGYNGPDGPEAAVIGLRDQAEVAFHPLDDVRRAVAKALTEPRPSTAEQILGNLLQRHDPDAVPGLDNSGLFATYELLHRVPERPDWAAAAAAVSSVRHAHGPDVLGALGWTLEREGEDYLLGGDGRHDAVAVVLEGDDVFDRSGSRYSGSTPVEHGLALAHRHRIHWVLAVKGTIVRLYAAEPDIGIGRKGTATFTQLDLALLPDNRLAYAGLLLTPGALRDGGTVTEILASSSDHAVALGARLRNRIYDDVIPDLATVVAGKLGDSTESGLERAYHVTLVILFRLLFVAYAEDRGLLPYRSNPSYTDKALKTRARRYSDEIAETGGLTFDAKAVDLWQDLTAIWTGIHDGHREWSIPAYGGSLFDPFDAMGTAIAAMTLTNKEIGPALRNMLVDTGSDGTQGPVDFQTLSVREFGTIYEGLLESSLSVAPSDLTLDRNSAYVPAKAGDDVVARAGSIYFHNASGARKATGSYFTKEFAVEHLLRTALEPSIDDHLARVSALLDDGREADAADALFDFRVADLAMGSGHFLIGAIDHLGNRLSTFLVDRPIPHALAELNSLRTTATDRLTSAGVLVDQTIDQMGLVRRQVARRCLYGVDVNRIAVDLARLAVWIHTFVPGLPMSTLEHGLVVGNSLTGIGTLDEALDVLEPGKDGTHSLFRQDLEEALVAAAEPLRRMGVLAEATIKESGEAAALIRDARAAVEPMRRALDAAVAGRLGLVDLRGLTVRGWPAVVEAGRRPAVQVEVGRLQALHFPVAFPEVFQRDNPGFDVILGNPPWEKVKVEEHGWWGLRYPGLRSMAQNDKNATIAKLRGDRPDLLAEYRADDAKAEALRAILKAGPYSIGSGDTDLYKVFCWRDWAMLRSGGRAGVVLPRGALSGSGTAHWREEILAAGGFDDVCFLTNTRQWVFDEVHPQYTIALTTICRAGAHVVTFNGPFHSAAEYERGRQHALRVDASEFAGWASGAAFPLLPGNDSAAVFAKMRRHPRFDSTQGFEFRPVAELHTSANRDLYDFDLAEARGRLPILTGASFNLWDPDFGAPYAYADRSAVESFLQNRRRRQINDSRSAFYGLSTSWANELATLPLNVARIAFRDVARATDSRTVIAVLVPPTSGLVEKSPYLFGAAATSFDEAILLGLISSIPFDWFARRFVELKLSYGLLNAFPIPRPPLGNPFRRRAIDIAGRLAAVDDRYADWAAEVGVPVGSVTDEATKQDLIAELDAVVSHLYGLDRDDVIHIFETFHRGWNYQPRLTAVLAHFDRWAAGSPT
jgi:hypothetical protein